MMTCDAPMSQENIDSSIVSSTDAIYSDDTSGKYEVHPNNSEQEGENNSNSNGNRNGNENDSLVKRPKSENVNYNYYSEGDPWQNWEYFHQYGRLDIHAEMLKDSARTSTYREALRVHAEDLRGKVVLDVGAGTGILSIFSAREGGAAKVYAIEASTLADWTELVIAKNDLSETVKVIKSRVEDVQLPEQVDVIVSEWMGTFLIFESMLESVLYARDRWLKPGGLMFPSYGEILLAPISVDSYYSEKVNFWRTVYDVDMSPLIPYAKKCALEKPIIDRALKPENVLADPIVIKDIDLSNVPINAPYEKTIVNFSFQLSKSGNFHGFAAWFAVLFYGSCPERSKATILSTAPECKDTHWHQNMFLFDDPLEVIEGQIIKGTIRYQRNPELMRHLIIDITFSIGEFGKVFSKKFFLWGIDGQT